MKRGVDFFLAFLLLAGSFPTLSSVYPEDRRVYPCYRLVKEPVMDGKVREDPVWALLPKTSGFFALRSKHLVAVKQTSFKMGYTPDALYIGIECEEPEVPRIKAELSDNDVNIWQEDSMEIFLLPKGAVHYYQFMINAIGSRWNGVGQAGSPPISLGNWQAKASQGNNYWSIEVKLPFVVLGKVPALKEEWRGNLCRNVLTSSEVVDKGRMERFTSWAHLEDSFHETSKFGRILFMNESLSVERVRQVEQDLGLPLAMIRSEVQKRINTKRNEVMTWLTSLSQQQTGLRRVRSTSPYQKEVEVLVKEYQLLDKQFSNLSITFLPEMDLLEALLSRCRDLLEKMDCLKSMMLVEKLFE